MPAQHSAGRGEKRRRRPEPGKGEGAWPPLGLGDASDPSDRLAQSGDSSAGPPSTRPAAGNAPRACAQLAATGINSRDVCACLFLSLEVAHFHFLLPFRSSASSVSACALCVCVGGGVRAPVRALPADAYPARGQGARGSPGARRLASGATWPSRLAPYGSVRTDSNSPQSPDHPALPWKMGIPGGAGRRKGLASSLSPPSALTDFSHFLGL